MADIIIHNATILTLDVQDTFYYPGTLEIKDDKILRVYRGHPDEDALSRAETVIDGTDALVMPGLVDLHFHTSVAKVDDPIRLSRSTRKDFGKAS